MQNRIFDEHHYALNKAIKHGVMDESYYPFDRNKYTILGGPSKKRVILKEDIQKIEKLD